jgi:uncharacterized protein (DUF488 family)
VLIGNLRAYRVEALVDVRSQPVSRFAPHYNRRALESTLAGAGVEYVFEGDKLGGRPADPSMCDDDGFVRYDWLSESTAFRAGIDDLRSHTQRLRTLVLCSEEDPRQCHRHLLIARVLRNDGMDGSRIIHIRKNGDCESDLLIEAAPQLVAAPWRSPVPLAHKRSRAVRAR